jgi:hypothetical protein
MSHSETKAIKEVEAKWGETSAKRVFALFDRVKALIKDSERVLTDGEKDRLIREEMEEDSLNAEEYTDTYKWLKECFLGRTL